MRTFPILYGLNALSAAANILCVALTTVTIMPWMPGGSVLEDWPNAIAGALNIWGAYLWVEA